VIKLNILTLLLLIPISLSATQFRVTNYSIDKKQCGNTKGITASGHKVRKGICAGDWKHYPPGTIIKLDTKELLVVADTGNKVKGKYHIDRYNPQPKKRFFPVTSRGIIIHRGNAHWRRIPNGAFIAVKKALKIRKQIIEGQKNYERRTNFRSEYNRSSRTFTVRIPLQISKRAGLQSFQTNFGRSNTSLSKQ
jgi:3D (Asp-Asp-Asp) domain-containing protein